MPTHRPIKPWADRLKEKCMENPADKNKRILFGVPVFRVPGLVSLCVQSLVTTPATILVVDNASDSDVKQVIKEFGDRIEVKELTTNTFCNGGWNEVLKYGLENNYDVIALGSSDVVMSTGWYNSSLSRLQNTNKEVWLPSIESIKEDISEPHVGWYTSFLPNKAARMVYPIPVELKHWFGDEHMYRVLKGNGWKHVMAHDIRCSHEQSAITFRVPEAGSVIEQDKKEWEKLNKRGFYGGL